MYIEDIQLLSIDIVNLIKITIQSFDRRKWQEQGQMGSGFVCFRGQAYGPGAGSQKSWVRCTGFSGVVPPDSGVWLPGRGYIKARSLVYTFIHNDLQFDYGRETGRGEPAAGDLWGNR